ncbi:Na(+) H(+) antiporter subunit D [hydrothermal vent metagenome]|uniref:Na(+) H(+) antiporter subunit D n=1 Tax=hydrothermal vent metagenome TaxID=652676 RepID=A0A3B1D7H2_9ZZZZ
MIATIAAHTGILTIILPFLSGVLCFLTRRRWGQFFGIGTAFIIFILTLKLGGDVWQSGPSRYAIGGWGNPLGIDLYLDGLSAVLLGITSVVGVCISIYASSYFNPHKENNNHYAKMGVFFWPLWLFTWGGLNALFLSSDIFNIYVTLEIIGFSAITLTALAGSVASLSSATRYLFLTLLGSLFYLLGVGLLYSAYSTLDLAALAEIIRPGFISTAAITLMTLGLIIKTALFPMHFWLPPAHSNAPAPVSAILSGLVIMGSFYLLVRLWTEIFAAAITPVAGHILGVLGMIAICVGSVQALKQTRLKMMLAYSTAAQVGYMFLLFPLITGNLISQSFAWSGGIYFVLSHACAKAAAFMVAGSVIYALGHDRINDLRGLAQRSPISVFAFALAGVSLMGLPPSGGFIGKWMLLKSAMLSGQWWYAIFIIIGGLLTAGYIFRVLEITFKSPLPEEKKLAIPLRMQFSALAIALVSILLGLAAAIPLELLKIGNPVFFKLMENSAL